MNNYRLFILASVVSSYASTACMTPPVLQIEKMKQAELLKMIESQWIIEARQ